MPVDARLRGPGGLGDSPTPATTAAELTCRHRRESGDPGLHPGMTLKSVDARLRGDYGLEQSPRSTPGGDKLTWPHTGPKPPNRAPKVAFPTRPACGSEAVHSAGPSTPAPRP